MEICIVLPISNTEVVQVLPTFSKMMTHNAYNGHENCHLYNNNSVVELSLFKEHTIASHQH